MCVYSIRHKFVSQIFTPIDVASNTASNPSKTCDCDSSGNCDCATPIKTNHRSSPSASSSGPTTPPPTSSCCSGKRNPPSPARPQLHSTPSTDKHTAALLDELARSVPQAQSSSAPYSAAQSYPPSTLTSTSTFAGSYGWHIAKTSSCSCGIACACPGEYLIKNHQYFIIPNTEMFL